MDTRITHLLESALADEPELRTDPATVLAAGRRRRRRRRVRVAAAGALATAGAVTAALAITATTTAPASPSRPQRTQAARQPVSLAAFDHLLKKSAAHSADAGWRLDDRSVDPNKPGSLAARVERLAHVRLDKVDAGHGVLNAGVASARDQSLQLFVARPGSLIPLPLKCSDLNGNGADGDLYYGACSIHALAGGGQLALRDVRTRSGKYAKTQAVLIEPDSSGAVAEATNQAASSPLHEVRVTNGHWSDIPPVVADRPALSAAQLGTLVRALAAHKGNS